MDDRSDILGGQLHVARPEPLFALSGPTFSGTIFYTFLLLAVVAGLYSLTPHYRQYQEHRHRTAMRRRHGIPDSDHRPFNVAYASVKRAHREREMVEKGKSKRGIRLPPGVTSAAISRQGSSGPGQALRQRQMTGVSLQVTQSQAAEEEVVSLPSGDTESRRAPGQATTASESDFHMPGAPQENTHEKLAPASSKQTLYAPAFARSGPANGKHTRDEEAVDFEEEQDVKTSRMERLDGTDEDTQWEGDVDDDMEVDEPSLVQRRRGTKRLASLEEDEGFESSKAIGRDKRARKLVHQEAKAMRGKKRDRAEAGSTFDGDNSSAEDENEDKHRSNRRRRLAQKKSLANVRGRKRVREPEVDSDDDDSDSLSRRSARHKRGRRSPKEGDFLSDDGMISHDPLCRGRRIGEEWESNGVKYKVGPNGQRLRQALVKKSRSRFPMPKDSEHPDRKVNVDVYVEVWLSEEEYQIAKEHNELAWQSPSAAVTELLEVPNSPTKGKSLLWSSAAQKEPIRKTLSLAKSVSANAALRATASSSSNGLQRRISTVVTPTLPSVPESPKVKSSKSYSKWEKQDLEAAAMARLREKVKADEVAVKKIVATTTAPVAFPTITATVKPSETSAAAQSVEASKASVPSSFAKPTIPTSAPTVKASTSDLPALSIPSSASKPTEPAQISTFTIPTSSSNAASEPVKSAMPTVAASAYTFDKPPAASSTTAPSGGTAIPKPFAKPAAPASTSVSAPNLFGNTQQPSTAPSAQALPTTNAFGGNTENKFTSSAPSPFGATTSAQFASQQPTKSSFSFGADAVKKHEERAAEPIQGAVSSGPSLLARMGGFAGTAASPTGGATASSSTAPASQPSTTFLFGKPSASASTNAPASTATSDSTAPVKFNFGVASKSAVPSASTANSVPSEAPKPTASFASGSSNTAASSSNAMTEVPNFPFSQPTSFGNNTSGTSGIFGNTNTGGSSPSRFGGANVPKDITATPQSKPAFGHSAFPSTPLNQTARQTMFGASTTPSGTPSGPMFGIKAEPQTPANSTATPMSTTPAGTPGLAPVFGSNAASTTPAGPPPKSMFTFGSSASTTPAGAPPKSALAFGTTAAPGSSSSLFGNASKFGAPTMSGAVGTRAPEAARSAFLSGPASGSLQPASGGPTTAHKFAFDAFSNSASPPSSSAAMDASSTAMDASSTAMDASGTTQNRPSFVFGNSSTPSAGAFAFGSSAAGTSSMAENKQSTTQPTSGMFGFGASNGPSFSFGQSKPPESGQK